MQTPDFTEYLGTDHYAGCRTCGGPVQISRHVARARYDTFTELLALLAKEPGHAALRANVEIMQAEAAERMISLS